MAIDPGFSLEDYRNAPSGEGPLAHTWEDKPHRLLYDLIGEIENLRKQLHDASKVSPKKVEPTQPTVDKFQEGYAAFKDGMSHAANRYGWKEGRDMWFAGWESARLEWAASIQPR